MNVYLLTLQRLNFKNMIQKFQISLLLLIVVLMAGCSTATKVTDIKAAADQAFDAKKYQSALAGYEQIIRDFEAEGRTGECPVYGKAGLAAMQTGNVNKALDYLQMDTYTPFVSGETYYGLAKGYREIDNLSKEMIALKDYVEKFPTGEKINDVKTRLFELYVESENWALATGLWPQLPNTQNNEEMLQKWFAVNHALDNYDQTDLISEELLALNPDNIPALEWQAEKAYDKAENHYQTEMEAYENNKTNKQYKRLLSELKVVTAEFQEAKGLYKKLYDLDPNPSYALYLSNIYARLNDKEKSDFYRAKSGN